MSRSYKKFPGFTTGGNKSRKYHKRQASKAARKADLSDGSNYVKVYQSYEICDFKSIWYSKRELEDWYRGGENFRYNVKKAYIK